MPGTSYGHLEIGPGLRVESAPIQLQDSTLRLTADLSYAHVSGNADNATTVELLGRDIEGRSAELGRDVLRVGGKLDLSTSAGQDWFAAYDGSFRQGAASQSVSAGLKISF